MTPLARQFVDVPLALLGYGNVGAAVDRLLRESQDDIERATGHRLRVKRALVRDLTKARGFAPDADVLTDDFAAILEDPEIQLVAELMGGVDVAGEHVLRLLQTGKSVVTANKQLVARRGPELFAAAKASGAQLRFEASVCAAIPIIKVMRESLVVSHVHRVSGIVNGTTNFMLTRMESGAAYEDVLKEAQDLGYAEADPTDDVSGADAAAKMAILATVAFGSRVKIEDVAREGIEALRPEHVQAAAELDAVIRLVGQASLVDDQVDVRVSPAFVDRHHPLAAVEGAMNAVLVEGDAIREIMLQGPGAGGLETASAVVSDLVSVLGTADSGFLQDDACWRELSKLDPGELKSAFYVRVEVSDQPGVLAQVAKCFADASVSVARLTQHLSDQGAALDIVTHRGPESQLQAALETVVALSEVKAVDSMPVISRSA